MTATADRSGEYTTLALTADDGTDLALHHWSPGADPAAAVFYVHGIQSHAGWLYETGPALAARGIAVFALDRRGSGVSGGPRGHLPSVGQVSRDYALALARTRELAPGLDLTIVGQSFGGSVLAALVTQGLVPRARLVFCAPALGQQRARLGSGEALAAVRAAAGPHSSPLSLADADYTDVSGYLDFMANDLLMIRRITADTRAVMVGLEDTYMRGGFWDDAPGAPASVHFARPEHDAVIDLATSWQVLSGLTHRATAVDFAGSGHYIEFSAARHGYWQWLSEVAAGRAA
ncbi:alpha/beta hydrolase [Actinacidiphila sp. ITFR-21]|uniref:alpha/beta hydrolase n=1 Tax=Actinacidiphila sp. ITFR-21 TaxID=3075199 RepID=UPI002889D823|nr:alpha/beta fold hydrolase [Streptomyces sp. ITFR-21]WNI17241.1 alpha/beta fold hydrolase [Streptomyces sp. ITFR-21]